MSSWRSTKDGKHFRVGNTQRSKSSSNSNDSTTASSSGSQSSSLNLTKAEEAQKRKSEYERLLEQGKPRRDYHKRLYDAVLTPMEHGDELSWEEIQKIIDENPKPSNISDSDYESVLINVKRKAKEKKSEILLEIRRSGKFVPQNKYTLPPPQIEKQSITVSAADMARYDELKKIEKECNQKSFEFLKNQTQKKIEMQQQLLDIKEIM